MIQLLLALIYVAFISLGLPDGLLGAAWPSIYPQIGVPVSYAGMVSMIIAIGTVISALLSDTLTLKLGTGKITAISVGMTAVALLGFSMSDSFLALCLWAVPYGLGAGNVDASLNNYVALHYESKHMSWLHCFWGLGATLGPYIMGAVLTGGGSWNSGYRMVGIIQIVLTALLFLSLPMWKERKAPEGEKEARKPLTLLQIVKIPGAKEVMVTFFCYCALENTSMLWAASYLNLNEGMAADAAASFASTVFLGLTVGRAIGGFLTVKFSDDQMIWMGLGIVAVGIAVLLLPGPAWIALVGLSLVGLGCAPIYPSVIHSTPARFGPERSQALIGVQMASAYIGICLMPPLFGLIAEHITVALLPVFLLAILLLMALMFRRLTKVSSFSKI